MHGADALGDAIGGTVGGQIAWPVGARRQALTRDQCHLGIIVTHEMRRRGQADAAKTTSDQIAATGFEPGQIRCWRGWDLGQGLAAPAFFKPFVTAPDTHGIGGVGHQLLQQARGQICGKGTAQSGDKSGLGGQFDIYRRAGDPGEFPWDDPGGAGNHRLFRVGQGFSTELRRARGKDVQMDGVIQIQAAQLLCQGSDRGKPHFEVAVKDGGAGTNLYVLAGDQPEMGDAMGQGIGLCQIGKQSAIAEPALFGGQDIVVGGKPCIGITGAHQADAMTGSAQPGGTGRCQPTAIGKDQPGLRCFAQICVHIQGAIGQPGTPDGAVAPVADRVMAPGRCCVFLLLLCARRDEITASLELVGGQRQAMALGLAPDLIPVGLNPAGPEPTNDTKEIGVIHDLLLWVAQGAEHLSGLHSGRHLGQGAQRLAGADLQEYPPRCGGKAGDTIGKPHRIAQLANPVIGVHGLFSRQRLTGPVGYHRDLWRRQGQPGEEGAIFCQDTVEHP